MSQMNRSAIDFPTRTRIHVSIAVADLERSLRFYKILFGQEPTKVRPGYAKFEVLDPPVNYALNEDRRAGPAAGVSHFGIQVKSTGEVLDARRRFEAAGTPTRLEDATTCCYAVQDKAWVSDPDGNEWEFFVVTDGDAPVHSSEKQASP